MGNLRAATSYDVARRVGVSQATVSVVLNGGRGTIRVSSETRRRILAAAAEMNYSPHPHARALSRRRSGVIAFVTHPPCRRTPLEQPIHRQLAEELTHVAARAGYYVIEERAERTSARTGDDLLRFLRDQRVEGAIFQTPALEEITAAVEHRLPVVQLLRPHTAVGTSTIVVDPAVGIAAAVAHLVRNGHRQIAFIGHGGTHPQDRARVHSFAAALAHHRIPLTREYLRLGTYAREEGRASTTALLALPRRPTAILAAADTLALGALHALHDARIRVPDGMSLVSYDDVYSAFLYPPLTSVAQPLNDIAAQALALLVERLEQPDDTPHEPTHLVLPTHLHVRDSTGPAPSGIPMSPEDTR